jgi:glycosyltransferase involved in cell wall biosynthesis
MTSAALRPGGGVDRPLRLLMVTPRFFPEAGGVETHVYEVARRLASMNVAVTVLCTDSGGELPSHEEIARISVRRIRAFLTAQDFRWSPGLGRIIGSGAWDLVHVQSYHTLVAPHAMTAALRKSIPYVLSFHAGGHSQRLRGAIRPVQQRLLRPLIARAAGLVVMARFEVDLYARRLRIPDERFSVIPNGADLPLIPEAERAEAQAGLIASIGRLERYKGHQHAINALPHVLRRRPEARLWIAGTGPYEGELRRMASKLGVANEVEFRSIPAGERRAMAERLSRVSLLVLLSEFETHPIAALEAIALGKRVLVANAPGLDQLAADGLARAVRPGSSPQTVATAMIEEMQRPPLLQPPQLPTWDECAERLLALYTRILRR